MGTIEHQVLQPRSRGTRLIPLLQQHTIRAGFGVQDHLLAIGNQNPGSRQPLAGFHILGKDQQLLT